MVLALSLMLWVGAARGDATKLDKPVSVRVVKTDKTRVAGRVSSFDERGFDAVDDKSAAHAVQWSELLPADAYDVFDRLLASGTADQWVSAGRIIAGIGGGQRQAERAFARALKLDSKVKDLVEAARKGSSAAASSSVAPAAGGKAPGKEMIGDRKPDPANEHGWPVLTAAENEAAVEQLKDFAKNTSKGKDGSIKLIETKYFLFYSDLPAQEAQNWSGLLDRMYARLIEMFALPPKANVFKGKALVFVFAKPDDYRNFEVESEETDPGESAGMCQSYGNGIVHIAFYRQPKELMFAHVLVHESVHGFIHRYQTPVNVPTWANEGLAEVIAAELVPQPSYANATRSFARDYVRSNGLGPNFFNGRKITGDQYPVAETFCAYMVAQNKKGYVDFIHAIKDGMTVDEAFEKKYGASRQKVEDGYKASMGAK